VQARTGAVGLIGLLAGLAAAAFVAGSGLAAPTAPLQTPPPITYPTPRFAHSGGPYIGETRALSIASGLSTAPVTRQDVRLVNYMDVVAFLGSVNRYYEPTREMYFVVTSGGWSADRGPRDPVTPCIAYITVIDATNGDVLEAGCPETGVAWPRTLPAAFNK